MSSYESINGIKHDQPAENMLKGICSIGESEKMEAGSLREMARRHIKRWGKYPATPVKDFAVTVISVFIAELFMMFLLTVLPPFSPLARIFFDSFLLVLLISPVLYICPYRSFTMHIDKLKKTEEQNRQNIEKLQRILGGTTSALASALAKRDPYTAGHQKRVAQLARDIGIQMRLSQERIEGIYIAASLHDIGKIGVPAEILAKSTWLTEEEFDFMKTHSQIGYEILKEIEFDRPIAQAVLQHHERLDGSGYPANISGNEIILEAKILAVADVIEAMSSYRPYRAACKIEEILEEIQKNKGIRYAPDVAEAARLLLTNPNNSGVISGR